jgi:hypothetical protein
MPTLTFWIDVDNTLLNNDAAKQNMDEILRTDVGPILTQRFWNLYEQVRHERDVVDIPLTLQRWREQTSPNEMDEPTYQHILSVFENFPFFQYLYPQTLETLQYLSTLGTTVIVSDGDMIFQAEKIFNSNLADAVEGRVLLYIHKQEHIDEIIHLYPADHYIAIDDKPQILADMQERLESQITTVFVRQGKYATAPLPTGFTPSITVDHIAALQGYTKEQFTQS